MQFKPCVARQLTRALRRTAATLLAILVYAEHCLIGAAVLDHDSYERTLQNILGLKMLERIHVLERVLAVELQSGYGAPKGSRGLGTVNQEARGDSERCHFGSRTRYSLSSRHKRKAS
ncbi:hypothetical protein WJX75_009270 [Coccomyxa subellipsoidea]|uniref:Secreted protein n=1 Tax=Coccomyxa subellipsoidea TaxID=248742 RepID=A0ABR2YAU4_9CHLO